MVKLLRPTLITISLLFSGQLYAQAVLEKTLNGIEKKSVEFPHEKTYLQLDKSYYTTGDTVWLKAYIVVNSDHKLSAISNVLNVELINSRDSILQSIKLFVKDGVCEGNVNLPYTLESGNYQLVAYTNWMHNEGDDQYFNKKITIFNAGSTSKNDLIIKTNATSNAVNKLSTKNIGIQFFAEGGNSAIGIQSKIAFKATDNNGFGLITEGVVTDDQGIEITKFKSNFLGMGIFTFTPDPGKTYLAKIKLPDSIFKTVAIPKAVETGYVLSVSEAGTDHIRIIVQNVSEKKELPVKPVILIGQVGGKIYYEGKSNPGTNSFITSIAKNKFPTGVVQFTLLSSSGEPLNERLVFVQNNDQLKLDVSTENKTYLPRQKVKIKLFAKTKFDKCTQGSFSVSVVNATTVPNNDVAENTILSNLLLTSDLKGIIEKPGYYFAALSSETAADLDALMLTQGYREFRWNKGEDTDYDAQKGLKISGYIKTNNGKPLSNKKVLLFATGQNLLELDTISDSNGHFSFNNLAFSDSTKFMLQGANEKERDNMQITVDKQVKFSLSQNKNSIFSVLNNRIDSQLSQFIDASKMRYQSQIKYGLTGKSKLLKEVSIREHLKPVLKHSDNLNGPGNADQVFTAKDIASFRCGFISTCLEGRLSGITLKNHTFYLNKQVPPTAMLVLIDGSPGNMDILSPNSIESIEVLSNMGHTAIYGGKGNGGIIVITTKRGADDTDITVSSPGTTLYRATGFYKTREFYSPQYDNPATNKEIADLRTTIYWNPMLTTDKNGYASFEYFNAGKGDYKVTVEGIDGEGKLGRAVYRYKVE